MPGLVLAMRFHLAPLPLCKSSVPSTLPCALQGMQASSASGSAFMVQEALKPDMAG